MCLQSLYLFSVYNLVNKTNNKQPSYMTNQFGLFEQLLFKIRSYFFYEND